MRLDKFLKVSRIIKRRTVANEVSGMGRVLINGNAAKPSKQVKQDDILEIEYSTRVFRARILQIPRSNVSISQASSLYEIID